MVLQALGNAIEYLTHATQHDEDSSASSTKIRVHKSDTFKGIDLKKLHTFLVQCKLNFQSHIFSILSKGNGTGMV
ncbi:hypothetical protein ID866_10495 [Astraeus odoratus]|nr:hypothetical protein ID866_10495 [Astraeus odoratus]